MKNRFSGKYYKFISDDDYVLAIIVSCSNEGNMLQVITNENPYLISDYKSITINNNIINFNVNNNEIIIKGELTLGELNPLHSKVMGPFTYLPLECKHSIYSMYHTLNGILNINGVIHTYTNSCGYIEGDSGRNFPKKYIWYNSVSNDLTLTLAIASIPLFKIINFNGLLCFIKIGNKEYKFCTYNFSKIKKISNNEIIIKKGKYLLILSFNEIVNSHDLKAPIKGNMDRFIKESITIPSKIKLIYKNNVLIEKLDMLSSLEYMWY